MKTLCIYHSSDFDGKCSAVIVRDNYNDNCDFLGWTHGQEIPVDVIKLYDKLILVDLSFPSEIMLDIKNSMKFVWIDHHISAINDSEKYGYSDLDGIRSNGKAACVLTWEYFNPSKEVPIMIDLIGTYDVWDNSDHDKWHKQVMPFQYGFRFKVKNYDDIDPMWVSSRMFVNEIIGIGEILYQNLISQNYGIAKSLKMVDFKGINMAVINTGIGNPLLANQILDDKYDCDAEAVMIFGYNGNSNQWKVSMYSNGSVKLSNIAKELGGGGHDEACGFICDTKFLIDNGII